MTTIIIIGSITLSYSVNIGNFRIPGSFQGGNDDGTSGPLLSKMEVIEVILECVSKLPHQSGRRVNKIVGFHEPFRIRKNKEKETGREKRPVT